jgi:2'-5' RNA ligase
MSPEPSHLVRQGSVVALETALILVPQAARPALEPVRAAFDRENVARGIPLHITLLYPFVGRDEINERLRQELTALFRTQPALRFALTEVRDWDNAAWAPAEPADGILKLSRLIWERFPEHPPYGGEFAEPTPHATLAEKPGAANDVRRACEGLLPIECLVRTVTMLGESVTGAWEVMETFALDAMT